MTPADRGPCAQPAAVCEYTAVLACKSDVPGHLY